MAERELGFRVRFGLQAFGSRVYIRFKVEGPGLSFGRQRKAMWPEPLTDNLKHCKPLRPLINM